MVFMNAGGVIPNLHDMEVEFRVLLGYHRCTAPPALSTIH